MTYRVVLESKCEAAEAALSWLEQRLRFEAWLDHVREQPPPQPGSQIAAAA